MQVNEIILQIMPVSDWFEWKILPRNTDHDFEDGMPYSYKLDKRF